jgi:hypothetical protein
MFVKLCSVFLFLFEISFCQDEDNSAILSNEVTLPLVLNIRTLLHRLNSLAAFESKMNQQTTPSRSSQAKIATVIATTMRPAPMNTIILRIVVRAVKDMLVSLDKVRHMLVCMQCLMYNV